MKLLTYTLAVAVLILSLSNLYMWKDRTQQWNILHNQAILLERLLKDLTDFEYEDETGEPVEEYFYEEQPKFEEA